jgi:hypothetical protein
MPVPAIQVDHPFFTLLAQHGLTAYLDDVMACYRLHPGGIYTRMNESARTLAAFEVMAYLANCSQLRRPLRRLALQRSQSILQRNCGMIRARKSLASLGGLFLGELWTGVRLCDWMALRNLGSFAWRRAIKLVSSQTGLARMLA